MRRSNVVVAFLVSFVYSGSIDELCEMQILI